MNAVPSHNPGSSLTQDLQQRPAAEDIVLSATESEKQIISVLIGSRGDWLPALCRIIAGGEAFTDPDRAMAWEMMVEMQLRQEAITMDSVIAAMRQAGIPNAEHHTCLLLADHAVLTLEIAEWHAQKIAFAHARRTMVESAQLISAADAAPREMAAALREQLATVERIAFSTGHTLPRPLPAAATLPAVKPLDPAWLPASFRTCIADIAERMQCPIEYPAVAIMACLSSVAGRRVCIQPKVKDEAYYEFPHLWAMVIGPPSVMKSPAIQATMRPLWRMEKQAFHDFSIDERERKTGLLAAKYRRAALESKAREAAKKGTDFDFAQLLEDDDEPSPCRRFIVNDASFEALGEVLRHNTTGTLLYQDEIAGLLAMLERDGNQSLRAFLLQAWSGKEGFTYDRIGRGVRRIEACAASILGGIQPGVLAAHVRAANNGSSAGADGFLQRFSLMVWPDIDPRWRNVDEAPDFAAEDEVAAVFEAIEAMDKASLTKSGVIPNRDGIPTFHFTPEAQECFNHWRHHFEHRLRAGTLAPAFEAHLGKYRKLVPALALLNHIAEWQCAPIPLDALERALAFADCLESHAARIYGSAQVTDFAAAHILQRKLMDGTASLPADFTAYDVRRRNWSGITRTEDAENACELLAEHGWLIATAHSTSTKGGRPTMRYHLNPAAKLIS